MVVETTQRGLRRVDQARRGQCLHADLKMSDSETASEADFEVPVAKRRRLSSPPLRDCSPSRSRLISPPPLRRANSPRHDVKDAVAEAPEVTRAPTLLPSPFQLTTIHDLTPRDNVDTVSLKDLIGDPLIKETWQFNYLIDLDFLMCV